MRGPPALLPDDAEEGGAEGQDDEEEEEDEDDDEYEEDDDDEDYEGEQALSAKCRRVVLARTERAHGWVLASVPQLRLAGADPSSSFRPRCCARRR